MRLRNNPILKKADRYLGIPLIWGMSVLKNRHNLPPATPRNFILMKTAAIGDTILLDAVIKEIRGQIQDAKITIVCTKNNKGAVELLTGVNHIIDFHMGNPFVSFRELAELPEFDCLMYFAPWAHINAIACYFIKAKFKTGFATNGMYRHYLYDKAVIHRDDQHEMDNYRDVLRACNLEVHGLVPHFEVPVLPESGQKATYVIFHMFPGGASALLRAWNKDKWLELAQRIREKYDYAIYLTGGKEDAPNAAEMTEKLQNLNIEVKNYAGKLSLKDSCSLLKNARLLVTVNTGIMHMAAAVGTKIVALHGATSITRWGPLSDTAKSVAVGLSCQPCISLGFESKCTEPKCMKMISVPMVMAAIENVMKQQNSH